MSARAHARLLLWAVVILIPKEKIDTFPGQYIPPQSLGSMLQLWLIPEGSYSKEEVDKAYSIALSAVVELSEMRALGYEIRESLFKAILTTPFESMHYVDTVGKAVKIQNRCCWDKYFI